MKLQELDSKNILLQIKNNIAVLLIGGAALFFFSCSNNLEKVKSFSEDENLPVMEVKNIETMFTDSGKVRFYMKSPLLLRFEVDGGAYAEFPKGIELIKYDEFNNVTSSIKSNYAKQLIKEEQWEVKNNVIVTNVQGDTIKTEHLVWDDKNNRIYNDVYVKIIGKDKIISGKGLEANESMTKIRILEPHDGTIQVLLQNNTNTNNNQIDKRDSLSSQRIFPKVIDQ